MSATQLEFREIHDTFRPRIVRYLTRLVGGHEAEDLTQEIFVKISRAINTFRGEAQPSTWIYRIATNAALDRLRSPAFQRSIRKRSSLDSITEGDTRSEAREIRTEHKQPSVEADFIRQEMNQCIRDFVDHLPPNYRTVVVLSELEDLKNSEIADILGVSMDTVKIRLHRARAKLKKELETHCSFHSDEQIGLACDLKSAFPASRKES
jgi:RNA polymerase sigma-70 factor (ECF subfamily)